MIYHILLASEMSQSGVSVCHTLCLLGASPPTLELGMVILEHRLHSKTCFWENVLYNEENETCSRLSKETAFE